MLRRSSSLLTAFALSLTLAASGAQAQEKKDEAKKVEEKKDEKKPAAAKAEDKKPAAAASKADEKKPAAATAEEKKDAGAAGPVVEIKTSEGTIKLALDEKAAPVTVKNFLAYVNDKFYDGTIFHRVIDGFMIQGGGYTVDGGKLNEKPTKAPIVNEGKNGLKNDKGTIAMARTPDPNSASAQWFINLVNNDSLNYPSPDGHGYAVFGKVMEGMDVVEKIGKVKTGNRFGMQNVPETEVKILSISQVKPAS